MATPISPQGLELAFKVMKFMCEGPTRTEHELADWLQASNLYKAKTYIAMLVHLKYIEFVGESKAYVNNRAVPTHQYVPLIIVKDAEPKDCTEPRV